MTSEGCPRISFPYLSAGLGDGELIQGIDLILDARIITTKCNYLQMIICAYLTLAISGHLFAVTAFQVLESAVDFCTFTG